MLNIVFVLILYLCKVGRFCMFWIFPLFAMSSDALRVCFCFFVDVNLFHQFTSYTSHLPNTFFTFSMKNVSSSKYRNFFIWNFYESVLEQSLKVQRPYKSKPDANDLVLKYVITHALFIFKYSFRMSSSIN